MAGPIARRPAGLLDLLLTQQQGKNPGELGDLVNPTIDLEPFYSAERLTAKALTSAVTAVGTFGGIQVPAGEVWKVYGVSFFANFATINQRLGISGEIINIPSSGFGYHDFGIKTADAAGDVFYRGYNFGCCIHYKSGATFRGRCTSLNLDAQPNIGVTMQLLYTQMEA